ncbi:hypothetical protein PAXRUDRAFT_141885 [Paxillus rubicundulus Ve08.2h10]|uniref:Unplaced genomic scaffold scaffold_254, whole genome shotgun sequence n=1 Tax=Paxillus rubicundulus Ve08.2h10 TaxID=930991 RepID=A0A0D0E2P1_9AGAM|nr:hypothetical protein PAXRUDRAFT_141885 [Paxillus rubicundulus Ve08.2h10]
MPVPSFLSSFADKAQNAINQSSLAGHLPGSSSASDQPSANQAAAQGAHRSFALESLQYQIRNIGQQYTSTTPIQRIITLEKGVALDCDALARDAKAQSKELYTWGQDEHAADLRDVTDRLAYLNFVQGSLSASLAVKLDGARSPLKALRSAETNLAPKRNIRDGLRTQIARVEHSQEKGAERRVAELREQLARAEKNDQHLEKEVDLLKRKAIRESEQIKWDAIREYGEKLVILSQAAKPIIGALPTLPPVPTNPYAGAQATAAARVSLQHALDNYKTGNTSLPPYTGADLSRSDTRSFGESHASELSSIASPPTEHAHPGLPLTPPPPESASPEKEGDSARSSTQPLLIDPNTLNQSRAPIPAQTGPVASPAPVHATTEKGAVQMPGVVLPAATPTIAETGVPVSAGASGPGPASGSLRNVRAASHDAGPRSDGRPGDYPSQELYGTLPSTTETAEEEKRRLEREERGRVLAAGGNAGAGGVPGLESAEDEKKRLERQERERVVAGGANSSENAEAKDGDELPPYQDIE